MKPKSENLGSDLSGELITAAIAVHREFGPGLNEDDYERALSIELRSRGIEHTCQVPLPLIYKGTHLDCGYRIDIVLAGRLLVELKAVEKLHPVHEAQLITYLRLSGLKLGLLINFASLMLRDGIVRRANSRPQAAKAFERRSPQPSIDPLADEIVGAALEVQHVLGTGLLRSAYEAALAHEFGMRGLKVERRLPVNLIYREQLIPSAKEIPMIVNDQLRVHE